MVDLTKLTDEELAAVASGNLSALSDDSLKALSSDKAITPRDSGTSALRSFGRGASLGFLPEIDAGVRAGVLDPLVGDDSLPFGERFDQHRDQFNAEQGQFNEENPVLSTGLEIAGGLSTGVGSTKLFNPTSLPKIAIGGSIEGAIAGAGFAGEDERATGAVLGGITGGLTAPVMSMLLSPIFNLVRKRAPGGRKLAESAEDLAGELNLERRLGIAEEIGIRPLPAQAVDDPVANQIQRGLSRNPSFSAPFLDLVEGNQQQANQIISNALGIGSRRKVSQEVFGLAEEQAGKAFNDVLDNAPSLTISPMFKTKIKSIADNFILDGTSTVNIAGKVNQLTKWANEGTVDAQQIQRFLSRNSKSLKNVGGDGAAREAFLEMQEGVIDEMLADPGFAQFGQQLQQARANWRTLQLVKPAMFDDTGNFSVARLASSLRRGDPKGFTNGRNQSELYNLARVGDIGGLVGPTRPDANSVTGTVNAVSDLASPQGIINNLIGERVSQSFIDNPTAFSLLRDPANRGGGLPLANIVGGQTGSAAEQ